MLRGAGRSMRGFRSLRAARAPVQHSTLFRSLAMQADVTMAPRPACLEDLPLDLLELLCSR